MINKIYHNRIFPRLFHSRRVEGVKAVFPSSSISPGLSSGYPLLPSVRWDACSASGGPRFYLPMNPRGSPLPLLASTVHAACGNQTRWKEKRKKKGDQPLTRTLCQISTVLSRKSDILHRLDSIIIMVFVVAFIQYVSTLSLSLSLSPSSSSLSARPPEDADVVLMTAMERVHVRGRSNISSMGEEGWGGGNDLSRLDEQFPLPPPLPKNRGKSRRDLFAWMVSQMKSKRSGRIMIVLICKI